MAAKFPEMKFLSESALHTYLKLPQGDRVPCEFDYIFFPPETNLKWCAQGTCKMREAWSEISKALPVMNVPDRTVTF